MSFLRIGTAAWADIAAILEYLAETARNARAAQSFLDEFDRKCLLYAGQPELGDVRDDLPVDEALRSFTFRRRYIAIYRPLSDGIDVLRVFDGRTDYVRHFPD
jgi:plasmid stabilization system protein ParE